MEPPGDSPIVLPPSEARRPGASARGETLRHRARDPATIWVDGDWLCIRGEVETGDQRGRQIGFPTANIAAEHLSVDEGVWAGWLLTPDGVARPAAISIGRRETIYGRSGFRVVEAHVLDFSGDLYRSIVTVELGSWIRRQRRFESLPALAEQIAADVESCRRWSQVDRRHPPVDHPSPPGVL